MADSLTARHIWAEMAANFMTAAGIDGFGLDIEGPIYTLLGANSSARAALTATLVALKARMQARVPGSLLAVWVQGGEPWTSDFDYAQLQAAFRAVDQFWVMDYSACGFPYAGMAEAPWRWVKSGQDTMDKLGFPRDKLVHVFPWHSCDFNCGKPGNPYGGVNCSGLAPKEYCADGHTFCFDNITTPGYAQSQPLIELGLSQGYHPRYNASEGANHVNYFNTTSGEYHQVWYDDPASLAIKYEWARTNISARGVGMWVPSATMFDVAATKAMWDAVPKVP